MRVIQIGEDPCLLALPGNLLQEAQVEGILEETLKRYLKEGWTSEIILQL